MPTQKDNHLRTLGIGIALAIVSAIIGSQLNLFEPKGQTMRESLDKRVTALEAKGVTMAPETRTELTNIEKDVERLDKQFENLRDICRTAILEKK